MNTAPPPLPVITPETKAFWEGCKKRVLSIQRCRACGKLRWYPKPMCPSCSSLDVEWVPVSGRGTIYTFTIPHQPVHPAFANRVPYVVVVVDLDEGVRFLSNLVECPLEEVKIGLPVEVVFHDMNDEIALPYFRPRSAKKG